MSYLFVDLSYLPTLIEMSDPKERQVHGPNWYLSLYKANDEIRFNSHRIVRNTIVNKLMNVDSNIC